jgi:hypothetical protein
VLGYKTALVELPNTSTSRMAPLRNGMRQASDLLAVSTGCAIARAHTILVVMDLMRASI